MKKLLLITILLLSGCSTCREVGNYARDVFAVSGPALGKVVHALCNDTADIFDKNPNPGRKYYVKEQ